MKLSLVSAAISLGMVASSSAFAQLDETKTNINQFVKCPAQYECGDRSNPVTTTPEAIIHPLSQETVMQMVYRVGLKPQAQQYVLVAEHIGGEAKMVRERMPTTVLVQPVAKPVPWTFVTPK